MNSRNPIITVSIPVPTGEQEAQRPLDFWIKIREAFDLADEEGLSSDQRKVWFSVEGGQTKLNISGSAPNLN